MSFLAHEENGLFIKTSTVLSGVRHGFSTRIGGVSPAPLGLPEPGRGPGDDMDRVRENYRRFCAALGVDGHRAVLSKVHEDNVRHVTAEDCGKGLFRDRDYTSVDAMVTDTPGIPWWCSPPTAASSCSTTRCTGPWARPMPAGAAAGGIVYKTVRRMQELFGTDPGDLRAAIGAAIGPCCFETDADVPQALEAALGGGGGAVYHPPGPKWHVDLKGVNARWLEKGRGAANRRVPRTAPPAIRSCTGPTGGWARPGRSDRHDLPVKSRYPMKKRIFAALLALCLTALTGCDWSTADPEDIFGTLTDYYNVEQKKQDVKLTSFALPYL